MSNSLTGLVKIGSKTILSKAKDSSIKYVPSNLDGCVIYLPLEEKSFNLTFDHSGKNNHGTVYGANTVPGTIRNGLYFDGIDDYVDLPETDNLLTNGSVTISAWIKTNFKQGAYGTEGRIVNLHRLGVGSTSLAAIFAEENKICFLYYNGSQHKFLYHTLSSNLYYDGEKHLITATHDGNIARLYYDGLEVASQSDTFGEAGNTKARVGSFNGSVRFFKGTIYNVKLYDIGLNPDIILSMYNQDN